MNIKQYRFQWDSNTTSVQEKMGLLHKQADRGALAWLTGFWWHRDAQDLARQMTAIVDERKAAIAGIGRQQDAEYEKQQAAEVVSAETSRAAADSNRPRAQWEAAQAEHGKALAASRTHAANIRQLQQQKVQMREPLPQMTRFRDALLAVEAPAPRPDFARFLLNMAEDEADAKPESERGKRRK